MGDALSTDALCYVFGAPPTTTSISTSTTTTTLQPLPESKCTAKKILLAGKKALAKAKCHSKAVKLGLAVDQQCLDKADAKFVKSWSNEEAKTASNNCLTLGDVGAIGSELDVLVDDVVTDLVP